MSFARVILTNSRGSTLVSALVAVAVAGVVSVTMVASHDSFLRQSRMAYVRSSMAALDNKIRFMATLPYAYQCAPAAGGSATDALTCTLTPNYFDDVLHVKLNGAKCAPNVTDCGFRLDITGVDENGQAYGYRQSAVDATGAANPVGVFSYRLVYEGTDYAIAPGGRDPGADGKQFGLTIPRDLLQNETFDCAAVVTNAATGERATPVFQGFGADGRPICKGFNACPAGSYAAAVDFKNVKVTCLPYATADKNIDCRSAARQQMITNLNWHESGAASVMDNSAAACGELPIAEPGTAVQTVQPVTPTPSAVYTWQGIVIQTTCPFLCDTIEWATCTGTACAAPKYQCYTATPRGVPAHPIGSMQTNVPTGYQCFPRQNGENWIYR